MLALVIDTSSAAVTAGLVDCIGDGAGAAHVRVLSQRVTIDARAHAELLVPSVKQVLAEGGAGVTDLAAVVAGVGPGPFTGLRVGLVTAAAMSDALGIPAYGVCSLDGIAAGLRDQESLLVATDARRREVYWAIYRHGVRQGDAAVGKPADVAEIAARFDRLSMAGAGARMYSPVFDSPLLEKDFPDVEGLGGIAALRVLGAAQTEPLTPLYLRRPDAVPASSVKTVSQR